MVKSESTSSISEITSTIENIFEERLPQSTEPTIAVGAVFVSIKIKFVITDNTPANFSLLKDSAWV
ncbi:MAG: hypothetical protein Q9M36_07380 [Sulfurovum sp.]|nr:hypothetical protein [Sulfurovum sp.]